MGIFRDGFDFILENPLYFFYAFAVYCLFFLASVVTSRKKPGLNPLRFDARKAKRPHVADQNIRDRVIKQGFIMKRIPEDLDTIVIGSGISGLTTAGLLAKSGQRVLVLEQHDQAGGCCHTFIDKGFEFDVGVHYIGGMQRNSTNKVLLDQLTEGQLQWAPLNDAYDWVRIHGETPSDPIKEVWFCSGKEKLKANLLKAFPDEGPAIDKFFVFLEDVKSSTLGYGMLKVFPRRVSQFLYYSGLIGLFTSYSKYAKKTSQELMDEITSNKTLQAVLCYSFGDYGTRPETAPAMMQGVLVNHFMEGGSYPVGGASEIAFHITPIIERYGGKVLVRAPVKKILFNSSGRACGVVIVKGAGGECVEVFSKAVISAAGIPATMALLPKEIAEKSPVFPFLTKKKIRSGMAGVNLFVGLKGTTSELGLERINVWDHRGNDLNKLIMDYHSSTVEEACEKEVPLLFVSFPSTKDPTWEDRYPGKSVCTIVTLGNFEWFENWEQAQVMHRGDEYEGLKTRLSRRIWQQVIELFPQLEDKVEYMSLGSPVTNNHYIGSLKGEMYGLDHDMLRFSPDASIALRPDIGVPGLLMSGQDIFTCGISGGAAAGIATAGAALSRDVFKDIEGMKKIVRAERQKKE